MFGKIFDRFAFGKQINESRMAVSKILDDYNENERLEFNRIYEEALRESRIEIPKILEEL